MGFVPDALVTALRRAPAGDPTVYSIDGMEIALRHETAGAIRVRPADHEGDSKTSEAPALARGRAMSACCAPPAFEPPATPPPPGALRTVVLIGPPNSGKSTLFNRLTGLRQKVANYPGVTVEQRMGLMAGVGRDDLTLIDLPGIYSLSPLLRRRPRLHRRAPRQNARHAQARRRPAGARFPAPYPPADARRAGSCRRIADPRPAQHDRPDGVARRPHRRAQTGPRTRRARGPDQRRPRHRP